MLEFMLLKIIYGLISKQEILLYPVFLFPSSSPDMKLPGWGPTHWPTSNPTLAKAAGAQTQMDQHTTESPDSCESNMLSEKAFPGTWHTSQEVRSWHILVFWL